MARYSILQLARKYLSYRYRRRSYKYIHSPFVHELMQSVLVSKRKPHQWPVIQAYRSGLAQNQTSFLYEDLGAAGGAKQKVTITQFQKRIQRNLRDQLRLLRMVDWLQPKQFLELGTATGVGTLTLALGNPFGQVDTMEGSMGLVEVIEPLLGDKADNITIHPGHFDEILPSVLKSHPPVDLILIDGNHTAAATLRYVEQVKPHLSDDGVLIVDDIRWSQGMENAWSQIIADADFHVTIDLFRWGWVFKRPGQAKEHFVL